MVAKTAKELRTIEKVLKWWFLLAYLLITGFIAGVIILKNENNFGVTLEILTAGLAGTLGALFGFGAYNGKFSQQEIDEENKAESEANKVQP